MDRNILRSIMKPSAYTKLCYEGSIFFFNKNKHYFLAELKTKRKEILDFTLFRSYRWH
jgi:hypothetical protein